MRENGRLTPAENIEIASLKGKEMSCPTCSKKFKLSKVSFASTVCDVCGSPLVDENFSLGKITGD